MTHATGPFVPPVPQPWVSPVEREIDQESTALLVYPHAAVDERVECTMPLTARRDEVLAPPAPAFYVDPEMTRLSTPMTQTALPAPPPAFALPRTDPVPMPAPPLASSSPPSWTIFGLVVVSAFAIGAVAAWFLLL